jgi:hypothetical protein
VKDIEEKLAPRVYLNYLKDHREEFQKITIAIEKNKNKPQYADKFTLLGIKPGKLVFTKQWR